MQERTVSREHDRGGRGRPRVVISIVTPLLRAALRALFQPRVFPASSLHTPASRVYLRASRERHRRAKHPSVRSRPRDGSQREVRVHARRSRRHFFLSFSALCEFTPASARPSRRAVFQPRDTKDGYFRTPPRNTSEPFLVKHRVDDESTRSFAMCLGATFSLSFFVSSRRLDRRERRRD